ncbi:helix-turn-helix domain-containing protein [Glycomyces scopariae]
MLQILSLIGSKWSILVIGQLQNQTMRFSELHRAVHGISQRMLTLTLRGLERDGLVRRTVHPDVPPRVDYTLTDLGATLLASMTALSDWASVHRAEINDHRTHYDAKRQPHSA